MRSIWILLSLALWLVHGQSLSASSFLVNISPCNESATRPCGTSAITCSNFMTNGDYFSEYLAITFEEGAEIYDVTIPTFPVPVQEYKSTCDTLAGAGYRDGSFLMYHGGSAKCNCNNPGVITCDPYLLIDSPTELAGPITIVEGYNTVAITTLPADVTAEIGLVQSGDSDPTLGCSALQNDLTGKIALAFRGACSFETKIRNAVDAGAIAVVIANTAGSSVFVMQIDNRVPVPAMMISFEDGTKISTVLAAGTAVNASYGPTIGGSEVFDSSSGLLELPLLNTAPPTKHTQFFRFAYSVALEPIRPLMWVFNPDYTTNTILVLNFTLGYDNMELVANITDAGDLSILEGVIYDIFTKDNRTYGFSSVVTAQERLAMVDITDPTTPTITSTLDLPYPQYFAVDSSKTVLYVQAGELGDIPTLLVVDVSDPSNMRVIDNITETFLTAGTSGNGALVARNKLWTNWGSDGVAVYDVSAPTKPSRLAYLDTSPAEGDYTVGTVGFCVSSTGLDAFAINNVSPTLQQLQGLQLNTCTQSSR